MLYEVITEEAFEQHGLDLGPGQLGTQAAADEAGAAAGHHYGGTLQADLGKQLLLGLAAAMGQGQDRITSYNVCYTKLLRSRLAG